ncbi:MAG: hypothetical protein GY765_07765, partial [bacterium]|nr:hypothetical protein [bacterium]
MPRQSRIDAPGALHHIIIRGIERKAIFKDDKTILGMFAKTKKTARKKYHEFVKNGVEAGRRPELTGGGLIRSVGGWKLAKTILKGQARVKGDERIIGDSDFVANVLASAKEALEEKYVLKARGVDFDQAVLRVAEVMDITPE